MKENTHTKVKQRKTDKQSKKSDKFSKNDLLTDYDYC